MEKLNGQIDDSTQSGVVVDWQERVTIHYRLVPVEKEGNICLLSDCPFSSDAASVKASALATTSGDYLCLEKANAKFQV